MSFTPSTSVRFDYLETQHPLWASSSFHANENQNVQQELRATITYLRMFESDIECEIYICQSKNEQILLIVSGQLGFTSIFLTHTLIQTSSVYVNHLSLSRHHALALKFTTIESIDSDLYELIGELKTNPGSKEKWFEEPLLVSVCTSSTNEERSSTHINFDFLHFQLLIDGLLRFPPDPTSREKLLNIFRTEYQDNVQQLSRIEEFESSYVPEEAVLWYTRDKFIYEILNKALRIQDINILFLYRFFLQDLCKQLEQLQRRQDQIPFSVYRGQSMSKKELNSLKKSEGRFISNFSFLSTSLDAKVSHMFVSHKRGDLCRVLFQIYVHSASSYSAKPFANISSQSPFKDEQEILFMPGIIFRLVDIRQENEITIIQMKLYNENYDADMERLLEHMQIENDKYHQCFKFGHVLLAARMYDQAEQFYSRMLNMLDDAHPLAAELWGSMGLVKKARGQIESSSEWLNKSLKRYEQMEDRTGVAKCFQALANIDRTRDKVDEAIDKYNRAFNIFLKLPGNHDKSIADCFNGLGACHSRRHEFTEALQYYFDALAIQTKILPHIHPDRANTINNIGNAYFGNGACDHALQYMEQALHILMKSLTSVHSNIAQTCYNMALAYLYKNDSQQSLLLLNRAISIYHTTLSSNHPEVERCVNTIDYIKQNYNK